MTDWQPGRLKPEVFAYLGRHHKFSVTKSENFLDQINGCTNFDFKNPLPELGEGLCLLNNKEGVPKGGYNMHFMAVIAEGTCGGGNAILVSDFMEPHGPKDIQTTKDRKTRCITSLVGLAKDVFGENGSKYVLGLVTTEDSKI